MNTKSTITIGIPTYLAGEHLVTTLQSVYKQTFYKRIDKIILAVDGNNLDENIVKRIRNIKLKVVCFPERKGQSTRINDIFKAANTDLLILLNDDVILKINAIEEIIKAFTEKKSDLICTKLEPFPPKSVLESVLKVSHDLKYKIVGNIAEGDSFLICNGRLLGLSLRFYKQIIIPQKLWNNDAFIYLSAKVKNYKVSFINEPLRYFRDPQYLREYVNQTSKFQNSYNENTRFFKETSNIKKYYLIPISITIKAFFQTFYKKPFELVKYLSLYTYVLIYLDIRKIFHSQNKMKGFWDVDISTKKI